LGNGPMAFDPGFALPAGAIPAGTFLPGAGAMPPGYAAPGAMAPDANGNPTITNEHTLNGIHGSGSIARKAGEVVIISYDLGTTACQFSSPIRCLSGVTDYMPTAAGCAYIHREADAQIGFGLEVVDQWPGQTLTTQGKTPSVLLYNSAYAATSVDTFSYS
jgi:hypothetical protein